jgi:diguanylate cyclase (GGDEF)-like protein
MSLTPLEAALEGSNAVTSESPVRILVVDDNAAKRHALQAVLAPLGHTIIHADSGLAALRCVMAGDFALILLDVRMPNMDGFETAELIRTRQRSALTPIIFITAFGSDEIEHADLYARGAVDFMFAPIRPAELRAKVSVFANLFVNAEQLRRLNNELTTLARQDPLTGLGNRRALEQDLDLLEARVTRYEHSYCIAVLDVDHFKSYNDSYGHPAGDQMLRAFANRLQEEVRAGDALYRLGGDEFLCVLPEQSLASGTHAVERMRVGVEGLAIPHVGNPLGILTFSAGLAILDPTRTESANEVLKEADRALYRAKELGRNRVEQVAVHLA